MQEYRASHLESFRRMLENDYATFEDFAAGIKGERKANVNMEFGTTVHKALELYHTPERSFTFGDVVLDEKSLEQAASLMNPYMLKEVTYRRPCTVGLNETVYLKGTVDAIQGVEVMDHKNTFSSITADKINGYMESYQWRAYLFLTGCSRFTYNVLQWKQDDGVWVLSDQQELTCLTYAGLQNDVLNMLTNLHQFVRDKGLLHYLTKGE